MKMKVMQLEKKEYNGKEILFPNEIEIETNDINLLHNGGRAVCVEKTTIHLTNKSFRELKRKLIETKIYERIMVL